MSIDRPRDIIDLHSHVIAPDAGRYPLAPLGGKQSEWSRERPVDADGMLEAMRLAGVTQTALVQASTCYGHDNRYVADSVAAHVDRFIGVFSVDMRASSACADIERWLAAGLAGARVFIAGHTAADKSIRLDDPAGFDAWSLLESRRIPVCVQIRSDGLDQVRSLLERFPGVPVLLDHFARPDLEAGAPYATAESLFSLARYPNLFCKFTTHNVRESREGRSTQAEFVRTVVDVFGADRIAWGSNFPASKGSLADHVAEALECTATLTSSDRDWIFAGTARRLYPALTGGAGHA